MRMKRRQATKWERLLQNVQLTEDLPQYIKMFINKEKPDNPTGKLSMDLNQHFTKEDAQMAKKILHIISHQVNAN